MSKNNSDTAIESYTTIKTNTGTLSEETIFAQNKYGV